MTEQIKGLTLDGLKSEMEQMIDRLMPKLEGYDDSLVNEVSFEERMEILLEDPDLDAEDKFEIMNLLKKRTAYKEINKLEYFIPYNFQKDFYKAGANHRFRLLMAGNRCGKSVSEAFEFAIHTTGLYPTWWEGHRFTKPILAWAVGNTGDSTRKVIQKELVGTSNAKNKADFGKGSIPRKAFDFKNGINCDGMRVLSLQVKYYKNGVWTGKYSTIEFLSVGQGQGPMMGSDVNFVWQDEFAEHGAAEVHNQLITRTGTTKGLVVMTATPEYGSNEIIEMFQSNEEGNLYLQTATWSDCPHFTKQMMRELLSATPKSKWEMRAMGIPFFAGGLVYEVDPNEYTIPGFEIPSHWPVICALDLGFTHDTSAVWTAYDPASDTIYVIDEYSAKGRTPEEHARWIRQRGDWIKVIVPRDALNKEKSTGLTAMDEYKKVGVNVDSEVFYNPKTFNQEGRHVEAGIFDIGLRMKEGRFKIFNNCREVIEGIRRYRRKDDGSDAIVRKNDDMVDAMRYSAMSVSHRGKSKKSANEVYTPISRWIRQ